jgi:hypothetical protein
MLQALRSLTAAGRQAHRVRDDATLHGHRDGRNVRQGR